MLHLSDNEFRELFKQCKTVGEFLEKAGCPRYYGGTRFNGTHYRDFRRRCLELGIKCPKRGDDSIDVEQLKRLLPECKSFRELAIKLNLPVDSGSLYPKLKRIVESEQCDISHFTGCIWSKGKNKFSDSRLREHSEQREIPWDTAFRKGSSIKNESLIKRLILAGKRKYECSICLLSQWRGKPIRLRLDHIDGDSTNCEENNLRIICPNCDSQTDSFCRGTKKPAKQRYWWHDL